MIPFKLLILGVFVVGVTVGAVVGGAGGGSGGCDAFNSVVESASDASDDATADAGDNSTDAPGTDDGGTDDGSTDDGGSDDGSGDGADGGTDDGAGSNANANGGANGNDNGSGAGNDNSNSNDNGGSNGNANDSGDNGPPPIAGAFAASLRATVLQSVGGDPSPMPDRNMSFSFDIGDDRLPENLPIINFSGAPNVVTVARRTTDAEETLTTQNGNEQITLRVRPTEAQYGASSFRVVHAINYDSTNGNLTRRGTGTQTIEASLDASGNLSFEAQVDYTIRFIVNNSTLVTATESIHAVGPLPRQP